METGCDASVLWNRPERFRRVCPLLKADNAGQWRCSVNTPDVRPFWGRAIVGYGVLAALTYVSLGTAAFGLLRSRGYPVAFFAPFSPAWWSDFPRTQSAYFAQRARVNLKAGKVTEAVAELHLAYQKDPKNYAAGFQLAQLLVALGHPFANDVYRRLAREHPAQRATTYTAHYQALLCRGDFRAALAIADEGLRHDGLHADAWALAFVFAHQREPNLAALKSAAVDPAIPANARSVFQLELRATEAPPAEARLAILQSAGREHAPLLHYYRPAKLIALGFPDDSIALIRGSSARLSARDRLALTLRAFAVLKWPGVLRTEFEGTLSTPLNAMRVEVLSAHLIRHPDAALWNKFFTAWEAAPLPPKSDHLSAYISLLCAAGANGDEERMQSIFQSMSRIEGANHQPLSRVQEFFRGKNSSLRIEAFLMGIQPLPVEVTYSLLERYYRPQAAQAAGPARP